MGLLGAPARSESNYRLYDDGALKRLSFIRRARALELFARPGFGRCSTSPISATGPAARSIRSPPSTSMRSTARSPI
ncbi:hypothetical protein ACRAWD_05330 [Caulobacter segnis]